MAEDFYDKIEKMIRAEIARVGIENSPIKFEDYDFAELVSDLTNSVTDQLYREFFPPAKNLYAEQIDQGNDTNFSNDLDVGDIVTGLKDDLIDHIKQRVAISLRTKMRVELEEQYHPKTNSQEYRRDERLKNIRKLAIWAYYSIAGIMVAITVLILTETASIAIKTMYLFIDSGYNLSQGDYTSAVDRTLLNKIIFSILSVLDLLLLASLVIMVLIGGYENTVGRIGISHEVPTWFGSLGITDLKIKVAASIVIISSIHLLTQFMLIEPTTPNNITPNLSKIVQCDPKTSKLSELYNKEEKYEGVSIQKIRDIRIAKNRCDAADVERNKIATLKSVGIENADGFFAMSYSKNALFWTTIVHLVFVFAALALAYMGKISESGKRKLDENAVAAVMKVSPENQRGADV